MSQTEEPVLEDENKTHLEQITDEIAWNEMLQREKEIENLIIKEKGRRRNKEREGTERRRREEAKKRIAQLREKNEQ